MTKKKYKHVLPFESIFLLTLFILVIHFPIIQLFLLFLLHMTHTSCFLDICICTKVKINRTFLWLYFQITSDNSNVTSKHWNTLFSSTFDTCLSTDVIFFLSLFSFLSIFIFIIIFPILFIIFARSSILVVLFLIYLCSEMKTWKYFMWEKNEYSYIFILYACFYAVLKTVLLQRC